MTPEALEEFMRSQYSLLDMGRFSQANDQLNQMIDAYPGNDALLHHKMWLLARQGEYEQAFDIALTLSPEYKQQPQVTFQIVAIMQGLTNLPVNEQVEAELGRILECRSVNCTPISEIIHKLFAFKIDAFKAGPSPLQSCSRCRLIHSVLRNYWLISPEAEQLCIELRTQLLLLARSAPKSFLELAELAVSISKQGYRNEYVFYVDQNEAELVKELDEELEDLLHTDMPLTDTGMVPLLAVLMYRPPRQLAAASKLRMPGLRIKHPVLAELVASDLDEQDLLQRYTRKFSQANHIARKTSAAVAQMYTQNPYPRWLTPEWNMNTRGLPYPDFYALTSSPGWRPDSEKNPRSMLVAGCGTGWHPISHAITFPWMAITAIDISPASLAYAQVMAERLGIRNIDFQQADIMDLGAWEQRFDIIESVGVLHHLQEPEMGLQLLVGLLNRGGILRLGLYSRLARQAIIRFRREHPIGNEVLDETAIRTLRHRFYTDRNYESYRGAMEFPDFFSVSGCRDLLLHEQETQYTVPELQHLLTSNSLSFLGFLPAYNHHFQQLGGAGSPFELSSWQTVEEKEPRLFQSMYQFFAQQGM